MRCTTIELTSRVILEAMTGRVLLATRVAHTVSWIIVVHNSHVFCYMLACRKQFLPSETCLAGRLSLNMIS
ncbi:hypothetical protein DPMN_167991 [Dreissena polymorpha]|uniref:Uncharacterized protein n=1 Tax=Dreissena polymorpha TaxID=45954 RepID=A0A9D4F178_DREPO|nr:hypothetical protein DPMN_167991 [Dreissena polymorpha]